MDINAAVGGKLGLTGEKIEATLGTGDAVALDARERLTLEFADRVTATPVDVSDTFYERLRATFAERELAAVIAHDNFNSRFNRVFRIESNQFCSLELPQAPPAPVAND